MKIIKKGRELKGEIRVPGDKSISHRSIMFGAIAEGDTVVHNFLKSADCLATIDCFRRMGIVIEDNSDGSLTVHGKGLYGLADPHCVMPGPVGSADGESNNENAAFSGSAPQKGPLDAMNSGTTVRLMSGILAGQNFTSIITGDDSLRKRPMRRIMTPLTEMGIRITSSGGDGRLPITIEGGHPRGIHYSSPVASAQVKSCVLLAGLYADEPTYYTEPALSRNHTELMLRAFGADLVLPGEDEKISPAREGTAAASGPVGNGGDPASLGRGVDAISEEIRAGFTTILRPGRKLKGQEICVPGDISSAAYFLAAGLLVPGSEILLKDVGINETRDGILRVIRAMGGGLEVINERVVTGEKVADLRVRHSALKGTEIGGALIPTLIDEIPMIAVMAAAAEGDTVICDAAELKVKETDRLAAILRNLRLMGADVDETEDGMVIHGKGGGTDGSRDGSGTAVLHSAVIDPLGDHRMAMAMSIAGLIAEGETVITDDACVSVSYPEFYKDLAMGESD